MKGFINFVREQGVVGLAVGFVLGGAVAKMGTALSQITLSRMEFVNNLFHLNIFRHIRFIF